MRWFKPGDFSGTPRRYLWEMFSRWDSGWYLSIWNDGYHFVAGQTSNIAFFPAYPFATGGISRLLGIPFNAAGFLLSNIALLLAALLLRRVVTIEFPDRPRLAIRSVWLLLSPVACFHSAIYTESLFLFLSLLSYCARRSRWALAGMTGAFLTATRGNGIFLLPALIWEAWWQWREARRDPATAESPPRGVAWLLLAPVGLLAYMTFNYFCADDAFAFLKAQQAWGRSASAPWWMGVRQAFTNSYTLLFIGTAMTAVVALLAGYHFRLRQSMLVYATCMLFLILSANLPDSTPRYLSVVFPL